MQLPSLLRRLGLALAVLGLALEAQAQPPTAARPSYAELVDPLTGTLSSYELSAGNTYPVISRP
ncbi:hypothetical protein [Porphyromonas sp.]